jgi:hypothetical protein
MTLQAALQHERNSTDHARNVSNLAMWNPRTETADWDKETRDVPLTTAEVKRREYWAYADHVWDIVPFWMKGVEGAERGEVFSMEEFLESLENGPWGNRGDWDYAYSVDSWGLDKAGWGPEVDANGRWKRKSGDRWSTGIVVDDSGSSMEKRQAATRSGGRERKERTSERNDDAYNFVEDIARRVAADRERKRRMHTFYEVHHHIHDFTPFGLADFFLSFSVAHRS